MKKLFILTIVLSSMIFGSFSFANIDIDQAKQIEVTEYYGYLSLIIDTHLEIGRWELDDKSIFLVVWLLSEMKKYADMDIIEYLWYAFDIRKSFDNLLYEMWDVLDRASISVSYIKKILLSLKNKKTECDSMKELVDKNFSLALRDVDGKNMELNLNKSLEYDKCSSDSRIYYNVQNKILEELDFYYKILEHKYNYFYGNRFSIVENYPNILYNLKK